MLEIKDVKKKFVRYPKNKKKEENGGTEEWAVYRIRLILRC